MRLVLEIELDEETAEELEGQPRPAVVGCARRALEDLVTRTQELRRHDEDLVARIGSAMPAHPAALTIAQAADALQLSAKTIRRMVDDKKLAAVRFGTSIRVPYDAVMALMMPPPPPPLPPRVSRRRPPT